MINSKLKVSMMALACSLGTAALAAEPEASRASDPLNVLLRQADYWENNQRADLARQALERYLDSRPNSPGVIYRLGMQARAEGRIEDAERWSERLRALVPDDQRLAELGNTSVDESISDLELSRVRRLAADGRYDDALADYQNLFEGRTPSRTLAPEYYQTLAGTPRGWEEARTQLQRMLAAYPEDQNLARAYAQVLTYQESTRRDGIDRLNAMVDAEPELRAPLRQALLWLDAHQSDRARYDRYMSRWRDDAPVMARFEQGAVVDRRQSGFTALNAGSLDAAEEAFQEALRVNPNDVDAQAGRGLVALRQQKFSDAVQWLDRAMRGAPARRAEWQSAYTTANYYASLNGTGEANITNLESELARVRALNSSAPGTRLIEADILRRMARFEPAEQIYREVLSVEPGNEAAQLGMVDVLRDRAATEIPFTAETTLRSALRLRPDSIWVRIDLGRLLLKEGNISEAERILDPLTNFDALPEQRAAAAALFAELQDWNRVESLTGGVSPDDRTPEMSALAQQSVIRQQFDRVISFIDQDRGTEASVLLESLYDQESLGPGMAGQLALSLNQIGSSELALRWVQRDLSRPGDKLPSEYGNHVLVLAQQDRNREADNLMADLRRATGQRLDERRNLMSIRHGVAVIRADKLRNQGQLASAYDQLAQPLREAPEDETLLLAMARVYSTGERHSEAQQLYNYVLERNLGSVPALEGAIQAALASGDTARAGDLVGRYRLENSSNPEHLILAARVSQQRGDEKEALNLLSQARGNVPNLAAVAPRSDGNPFRDTFSAADGSSNLSWLPGREPDDFYSTSLAEEDVQNSALVRRIDTMIADINTSNAPRIDAGMELNVRSGESGMSQLERLEATPMTISGTLLGDGRLALEVTPALLNSGNVENTATAQSRFGHNALAVAAGELGGQSAQLDTILSTIETSAMGYFTALARSNLAQADPNLPDSEKLRIKGEANAAQSLFNEALKRNPIYEAGIRLENLTEGQKQTLASYFGDDVLATNGLSLSGDSLEAFENSMVAIQDAFAAANASFRAQSTLAAPDYQRGAGLGLGLRYTNGSLGMDIGTTPIGFEESNVIGGLQWQPALTPLTRLNLRLEQRPVKDSILSYAGTKDPYTGESWGGVVKRGGGAGIAFQSDAGAGLYADLAAYQYMGNNVADNRQIDFSVGGYVRPYNSPTRYLQTGIHLNAMGFTDNLSYFSAGHGGYFSPQEFFSIAFPITYSSANGRLQYQASLTPGYQSFTLDSSDYYPTNPEAQELLNIFSIMNAIPDSRYKSLSQNGIGMAVQGGATYQLNSNMQVGGAASFSSFGAFNDYTFKLYLQYRKGDVR